MSLARRRITRALALTMLGAGVVAAVAATNRPSTPARVLPDVPVTAVDLEGRPAHGTPEIRVDPTDARIVALADRLDHPRAGCALHMSADGGRSWLPARPVPRFPPGADLCYGPQIDFDSAGTLYYFFLAQKSPSGAVLGGYLTTSSDHGRTFAEPRQVLGPGSFMVDMAYDTKGVEALHLAWLQLPQPGAEAAPAGSPAGSNRIMATHSEDRGKTFSPPAVVSGEERALVGAPAVAFGPGNQVVIAYYDLGEDRRDFAGEPGPVWEGTWTLLAAASDDGGHHFEREVIVDNQVKPIGRVAQARTLPPPAFAIDEAGTLHLAWHDSRHGDPDVLLSRSTDRGGTWSAPHRLGDQVSRTGHSQYLPALSTSEDGRLDVVYADRGDDDAEKLTNVVHQFSLDGGLTFSPVHPLTSEPSPSDIGPRHDRPDPNLVDPGSGLGLASSADGVLAAWPDTRNAQSRFSRDIFATTVQVPGNGRVDARLLVLAGLFVFVAGGLWFAGAREKGRVARRKGDIPHSRWLTRRCGSGFSASRERKFFQMASA